MNVQALSIDDQYTKKKVALIGYGVTGKACAQYLLNKGAVVSVFDRATHNETADEAPNLRFYSLNENTQLHDFDFVVVSPGVNLQQTFIQTYLDACLLAKNVNESNKATNEHCVIGDIELFAREFAYKKTTQAKFTTKIIGITGSNGKSTVVDMLSRALSIAGLKVGLGGNFGTSALQMLEQDYDVIVLELSSFQLESTYSLVLDVACVLNVTPDHIDRHGTMQAYAEAKRNIYKHAHYIVYNRDDPQTQVSDRALDNNSWASFGSQGTITENTQLDARPACYYFQDAEGVWCHQAGKETLLLSTDKVLKASAASSEFEHSCISWHQLLNMQVVFACCHAIAQDFDLDITLVEQSLYAYKSLAHRFETVQSDELGTWINDSKATNPGASIAAIQALVARNKDIVLIAGGDAKNADLTAWFDLVNKHVKQTILIGKDAQLMASKLDRKILVKDLAAAVSIANTYLQQTDQGVVLLSPACASIDMFDNFQQRGDTFTQLVLQQVAT